MQSRRMVILTIYAKPAVRPKPQFFVGVPYWRLPTLCPILDLLSSFTIDDLPSMGAKVSTAGVGSRPD